MELKTKTLTAAFWVGLTSAFSKIVSFATTLILARLLTPNDFGLIAYGFLIIGSIGIFREMGLNRALIYQKRDIATAANTAFFLILAWSVVLYFLAFFSSPYLALFFNESNLNLLIKIMALSLVLTSLTDVPFSLLEKEIRFKQRVIPESIQLTTYGIVSTIAAFKGCGYWSFVIGQLSADVLQLGAVWFVSEWRPRLAFSRKMAVELFGFGKNIMGLGVVFFAIRNIDDAFVGKLLGTATLGIYNFAYRIANIPATHITNVIGRIMFPVYSKISNYTFDLRNAFLKTLRVTSLVSIPVAFLIVLVTPDFINLYFEKWRAAILPIQLLAIYGLIRSLGSGMGGVFLAKGKPEIMLKISAVQLIILGIFLYPVTKLSGVTGVCALVIISIFYSFIMNYRKLKNLIGFAHNQIFQILFPILIFSSVSYIIPLIVCGLLRTETTLSIFVLKLLLMLTIYFTLILIFFKDIRNVIWDKLKFLS
ncbi:lipopolysaccharide biosynthesis protein [candidate division KSB1 bacterium]|nr:lipopolysaccharide biosynthesis protein [candidate division KSB1 bacterium]